MSQANNEAFDYEPLSGKQHAHEDWWKETDPFAQSSVLHSKKIHERHDLRQETEFINDSQTENFFNPNKADSPRPQIRLSRENKKTQIEKVKEDHKNERWFLRRGHTLSYIGLFLFTLTVYFRPYELIPALSGLTSMALVFAVATLLIFLPTQLGLEGNFTARPTEVNLLLIMIVCGLITIPIAKSPALAWETFNDIFIKAALMFIVMVNVIRTEYRLKGLIWLSIAVGVWLSLNAIDDYQAGNFTVEGYRVEGSIGGMFGNPNDMALHLVTMIPLTLALFINGDSFFKKAVYGFCFVALVAGNMITFSRGGFLGMMASLGIMIWKLGKNKRFLVTTLGALFFLVVLVLAPGNYAIRILSIFIPGLDPVGSSDQRSLLLQQSIFVTLRNPWGIGMGNFTIVSSRNLVSHNAYTEVSAEMGILALIVYVAFMVKPLKRLGQIEKETFGDKESSRFYYLAIGLQASLVGFMVGSFFASVAYQWFIYYLVAYAIAFRRIYALTQEERRKQEASEMKAAKPLGQLSKATI